MTLRIYNTIARRKEDFIPLEAGIVKMYVCGVTVYDYCHLGHARAYVVWDMIRRYLATKYQVKFVQNITDIDDKILKRAQERNTTMQAIANQYIAAYDEDMAKLNIAKADAYPRATESIPEIIELIQQLIDREYAYASGGDIYYAVQKFPSYGKLSGRKLEDMQAGASGRVDEHEAQKRYPFDFALWKSAKPNEPFWASPWGDGRPGWHIECSAMVRSQFKGTIDIHAGGSDLQFPHHENEIAQSEVAYDKKPLAKYWMHNGFVNIDGEKMSKSLHNFKTIRDLFEFFDPMAIRLFILQAQYRKPIDFTREAIDAANKSWEMVRDGILFFNDFNKKLDWKKPNILNMCNEKNGWLSSIKEAESKTFENLERLRLDKNDDYDNIKQDWTYQGLLSRAKLIHNFNFEIWTMPKSQAMINLGNESELDNESKFKTIREDAIKIIRSFTNIIEKLLKITDIKMICQFEKAMDNDFNTSIALSYVFELAKKLRSERNSILHSGKPQSRPSLSKQALSQALFQEWQTLKYMTDVLGFGTEVSDHQVQKDGISEADIESLIQKRIEAKKAKNYQEGDRIRNELKALNITLIDQKDGTTRWIRE